MAKLYVIKNNESAKLLLDNLEMADNFWTRGKGLLGRKNLPQSHALWIKGCNNIHTCFMQFTIDCIFVDDKMKIQKLKPNVSPFRFAGPYWKSTSVIEASEGQIKNWNLELGDQLYVVD